MSRFLEIVVLIVIVILISTAIGCSLPWKSKPVEDIITKEPPTPAKQLYNAARKSNWLVTMSILGIAGGVFAMMSGASKLGIAASISSSISLFMALAVARFALWMAVFGLIGSLAVVLFSILVRRKALVEIIKGVQVFRTRKAAAIALQDLDEQLGKQVKTTKVIVNKIKNELKLKGQVQ